MYEIKLFEFPFPEILHCKFEFEVDVGQRAVKVLERVLVDVVLVVVRVTEVRVLRGRVVVERMVWM